MPLHGQDTYCISTETGATHYGGVRSWGIAGSALTIHLDEEASAVLGTTGYRIDLMGDLNGVQERLRQVLGQPGAASSP